MVDGLLFASFRLRQSDSFSAETSTAFNRPHQSPRTPLPPLARAFTACEYPRAVELLLPLHPNIYRIGGSHAQRDLIAQTLIAAAERPGQPGLAPVLPAERIAVRPTERTRRHYATVAGKPPVPKGEI
jgi:hypothetical protein